jgi:hypothetical protein
MLKRCAFVTTAIFAIATATASAASWVDLSVSPKKPIVDDSSIRVRWTTNRTLKPGEFYGATLVGARGANCASFVTAESSRKPGKGKPMSLTLSSYDDIVNGGSEWCQGKASVTVYVKKGERQSIIGIAAFRFSSKP